MNRNKERKERLFTTFAANLSLYEKSASWNFVCPLCLGIFGRAAIDLLDLAHIVPDALGGSKVTLTCKVCNNRIGREIECHEVTVARYDQAFKSRENDPITGRFRFHHNQQKSGSIGVTINGVIGNPVSELYLRAVPKMTNPAELQRLQDMFKGAATLGGDWGMDVQWPRSADSHRAQLTYLHIAYLYLFHQFGYEWALSPGAAQIREQFDHPDQHLVNTWAFTVTPHLDRHRSWGVSIVYAPEEAIGLLVTLPPLRHIDGWAAVWMPLFGGRYDPPKAITGPWSLTQFVDLHPLLAERDARFRGCRVVIDVIRDCAPDLYARL